MVPDFVAERGRRHGRRVRPPRAERAVNPLDQPRLAGRETAHGLSNMLLGRWQNRCWADGGLLGR